MIARRVMISGRVQGVGYRAWVAREAARLMLNGWVRNRISGEVEAVFAGELQAVEAVIESCRRGPRLARVASVVVSETDEQPAGFEVRPTT
jgi:acylphosphatase